MIRPGGYPAGTESSWTRVTFRSLLPFLIHDERLSAHEAGRRLLCSSTDRAAGCQAIRERRPKIGEA
jgi:hypothetical protein